jgi:large subunit ribosomal protein L10
MSKYVKELIADDIKQRLEGVEGAVVVSLSGLTAQKNHNIRAALREKDINVLVVKNSLARKATAGTLLAPAFEGLVGPAAVAWGASDIVALTKEIIRLTESKDYEHFQCRGGVLDGQKLTADEVKGVSKWPSREEQLSIIAGQILGVGATLSAQLIGPGGALASQIKQIAEKEGEAAEA